MPEQLREDLSADGAYIDDEPRSDWISIMQQEGVHKFSSVGVLGNPALASADAGVAIFEAWVDDLLEWINDSFPHPA